MWIRAGNEIAFVSVYKTKQGFYIAQLTTL